jgi:hypothetical protein
MMNWWKQNNRFGVKEKDNLHETDSSGYKKNYVITIAKIPADSQAKTISELNDEAKACIHGQIGIPDLRLGLRIHEGNELNLKTIHGKEELKQELTDASEGGLSMTNGRPRIDILRALSQ